MYFIMPNVITLHSFAFFVQFADLKIDTCKFTQKTYFALKTVSQSPQLYVDCIMVKTYQLLYIQRSSHGHLNPVFLPSHHAWFRIYSQPPKPILFTINS